MSWPALMAALATVLALVGFTVIWFAFVPQPQSTPPASQRQRQPAEDFLGSDPNRSVRGGQEIRPRW